MSRPFFGAATPIPFAHRGGALRRPENTLLAFRYAAELGYQYIETDIHETADGRFVLFHDPTLERTTDGRGNVAELMLAELKRLDAGYNFVEGGSFPFRNADIRIPTLEEALELDAGIRYNLEVKPEDPLLGKRLWEFIDHHGIHDRVLVASEHDIVTDAFRSCSRGRVATSSGRKGAMAFWTSVLSGTWKDALFAYDALQIPTTFRGMNVITPKFLDAAHHHGIQVHVWTINDPTEMYELLTAGVDGIMTDVPDVLLEVLAR